MWKNSKYLEIPGLGDVKTTAKQSTDKSCVTMWLPSPIPVRANSTWAVKAANAGGGALYASVILHISYAPIYSSAGKGGSIIRLVSAAPSDTDEWSEVGSISDLDPSKNYIITGVCGIATSGTETTLAVRLRADSFNGVTPIVPAISTYGYGSKMLNEWPEGNVVKGTDTIYIDAYQISSAETNQVYVVLSEE